MTDLSELLAHVPVDQIAARLGVDPQTALAAVQQALPALVGGMSANAADPAGAASLAGALGGHDPSLIEGGVNLDQVDEADGARIVQHVFGDQQDQVVHQLGAMGPDAVNKDLITRLLPLLAPIVMSYLAKQMLGGGAAGGLGGLLGGLLAGRLGGAAGSGQSPTPQPPAHGIDLGSILGGLGSLLGRGRR